MRGGEAAVERQVAMRRGGGDGACHSMLRDVSHGLCAGQGAVLTHS